MGTHVKNAGPQVCIETNTPNWNRERDYINVFWVEIKCLAETKSGENKIGEPTNLKERTTLGTNGNTDADRWWNKRCPTEIERLIKTIIYLALNQIFGKDKCEKKWKRHRDKMQAIEEIGRKRRKRLSMAEMLKR